MRCLAYDTLHTAVDPLQFLIHRHYMLTNLKQKRQSEADVTRSPEELWTGDINDVM